jgi:Domain of unknown function (DUF4180)
MDQYKLGAMNTTLMEREGHRLLVADEDGPRIGSTRDAVDLITEAMQHDTNLIAVPVARFDPEFFRLRSGIVGEFVGKLAVYKYRLAVVGDISGQVAASDPLRDFVRECKRGRQVYFVADLDELAGKLGAATKSGSLRSVPRD